MRKEPPPLPEEIPPEAPLRWKTVTTVSWIAEADRLAMLLEAHNIPCQLPDQGAVMANPLYSGALGGIRVQVPEDQLREAAEVLAGQPSSPPSALFTCPKCDSDQLHVERVTRRLPYLSLLVIGFPLLRFRNECVCDACGHRWPVSWKEAQNHLCP